MRRRSPVAAAALGLALLWALPARSQPVASVDGRGRMVRLASPPRRIVSLAPAVTEILFALGVGDRVVGATAFCDYPPAARRIPRVGDSTISVEKIVSRRPDLVVASGSADRKAIDAMERMPSFRVPIFVVDPNSFEGLYAAIGAIGRIVGRPQQAAALCGSIRARVDAVVRAVSARADRPKVLIVVQPEPLWVAGSGTFMDEMVRLAGGVDVASGAGTGYHTFPIEKALAARPDVVLVGKEGLSRIRSSELWKATPAYRSNRIYAIDPSIAARPGPRLADALEQIARLLHPGIVFGRR